MANQRARTLRTTMSDAESRLWQELRLRQVDGVRFRRQHPIGRYIADFVCLEKRLIVEVDGEQHTQDAHAAHDAIRDRWLTAEGYRVMRFQTVEVHQSLDGVVETIWGALQEMPSVPGPGRRARRSRRSRRPPAASSPPPETPRT
jgi:very-short-patch-repair endonuclease